VDVLQRPKRRDVRARVARPHRTDERERPRGAGAGDRLDQPESSLVQPTAPVKTIRGAAARPARRRPARRRAPGEQPGVGDVRGVDDVARQPAHALGQRRRGREHEVGARGEALLGRRKAAPSDAALLGDVVHAVVDDGGGRQRIEEPFGLGT
jgi:hypothetical protein